MKKTFTKIYTEDGQQYKITAEVRFDDECKNGHKTFAITGEILRKAKNGRWVFDCCGQIQDDIAKHFPDLVPFFKWHLCSTDGPLHYLANTLYHASDKDHWGRRKEKEPDIEAARKTAIWPDATLEQLQDEEQLKARLPGLLAEFRAAVESLGFEW